MGKKSSMLFSDGLDKAKVSELRVCVKLLRFVSELKNMIIRLSAIVHSGQLRLVSVTCYMVDS